MTLTIDKSNVAQKARRELELTSEDPEIIDWYCRVIDEFFSFGHSGGSFDATLPVLVELLKQGNLTPLTSDSSEWIDRSEMSGYTLWQNNRNSSAFSRDGGKTFWYLDEPGDLKTAVAIHVAIDRV